jgi:hypothetical protein
MKTIKLTEWCAEKSINYLTAYRWFKAGKFPEHAYQTDSGTILVEDTDNAKQIEDNNNAMAVFLKKTVEFSKNNSTVEDFAAYVISTFQLKIIETLVSESPLYSKNKPKTEDIQKHFQKFIPEKNSIDHLKMIKSLIKDNPNGNSDGPAAKFLADDLREDLSEAFFDLDSDHVFSKAPTIPYQGVVAAAAEGVTARNVEFVSTPQQTNYTGSTVATSFGNNFSETSSALSADSSFLSKINNDIGSLPIVNSVDRIGFTPPTAPALPKRRGRKPSKKSGSEQ